MIANTVTSIGDYAFGQCTQLKSIKIPNSVTEIGDDAFKECDALTNVTIPGSVANIGGSVFYECENLTTVALESGVTAVSENMFRYCAKLSNVTISEGVMSIGEAAFESCSSLTNITLPKSLTEIGNAAFSRCPLTSVTVPGGVKDIGRQVFYQNEQLTKLVLQEGIESIGYNAFADCTSLTEVTFPNGLKTIGRDSFYGSKLNTVTIPKSVTTIGAEAFDQTDLTDIYYMGSKQDWQKVSGYDQSKILNAIKHFQEQTPSTPKFQDVPANQYYATPVQWAVEKNITSGTSATTFSPNKTCTRAEIVCFLYRAAGAPNVSGRSSFQDVPANAYYADAVQWAVKNGITSGTSTTQFSPNKTCTRAETVMFLHRAAGTPKVSGSDSFQDVPANAYFANAVRWAAKNGITSGTSTTQFSPNKTCTRAEAVTFLYRAEGN